MTDPPSSVEQSGNATASGGGVANSGIVHGGIHQHVHLPAQRAADEAAHAAPLSTKFRAYADNELRTLVDWGQMRVPWHRLGHDDDGLAEEADLARHICGGGRLVMIGDSQSGKTTLAYSLMRRLDAENCPSVLLRLRSWVPARQRLEVWISGMLRDEYGLHDRDHLRAFEDIVKGRLVPIFDGFDELGPGSQRLASEAFRQFTAGKRAVLTGVRTPANAPYLDNAVPDAAVIELDPVGADELSRFLLLKVPPLARPAWAAFSGGLTTADAARAALSRPLNAWLAKTVYAVEDDYTGRVTDLLALRTPGEVEQHLLQRTITAIFTRLAARPDGADAPSDGFVPAEVEHWLGFLGSRESNEAIAFWQLRQFAPTYRLGLAGSVVLGVTAALLGGVLPPAAVALFLLTGVLFGFAYARGYSVGRGKAPDDPTRIGYLFAPGKGQKDGDLRDHARKLVMGAGLAATCYLATGAVWWPANATDWWLGMGTRPFIGWVVVAALLCPAIGFGGGRLSVRVLRSLPRVDAGTGARTADPLKVINSDRRSGIGMMVLAAVTLGSGYLIFAPVFHPPGSLRSMIALPVGVAAAVFFWNQWAPFKVAHLWLYLRDRLPWAFAQFLKVCHDSGVLRQNGNHYIFRHDRLRACLASMYERGR